MLISAHDRTAAAAARLAFALVLAALAAPVTLLGQGTDTVRAGPFDAGRMWTFEYPPARYFSESYGFRADSAWFARARLAALRIPGCSASFVSPNGLVVTNHHCARGSILAVQEVGEHFLDTGFKAITLADERRIPGYYVDQLIAVEDVSDEVFHALDAAPGDSARQQARQRAFDVIRRRLKQRYGAASGGADAVVAQVVALYQGGRYSAYVFHRYTDVRLVAAPEEQMGFFGGDPDNFSYPRYDLDFSFLRVYDAAGKPLATPDFFRFSVSGVREGDPVFVIGNSGPTARGLTVAELEFQRDFGLPPGVAFLRARLGAMRDYMTQEKPSGREADALRNQMFGISNGLKARGGMLAALQDPVVMAKRRDAERTFRAAVEGRPELARRWGPVFDQLAALQQEKAKLARQDAAFVSLGTPGGEAATLLRALEAARLLASPGDTTARRRFLAVADYAPQLERRFLELRLAEISAGLGAADPLVRDLLQGQSPAQAAQALIAGSALSNRERAAAALDGGTLSVRDPAIRVVTAILPALAAYDRDMQRLSERETDLQEQLGRARFDVYGTAVPPDATFSPRISDGVVQGYEYNGTKAPWHTTFYGMYDRYYAFREPDFALPPRWVPAPPALRLETSLDFVSTADTYSGNSGSPAVSRDLELVGLNFDRNVEGLSRAYIYLPERGQRNVMVDVCAIREALDRVYHADRIVRELATGKL
jgi:hypothetical protein